MFDEKPNRAVNLRFFDNYTKDIKEFSLSDFQVVTGDGLLKLWTKGKLDYLSGDSTKNRNQIIQLSIETGIPTKLTSFVCVKENNEPVFGEMVTRNIPRNKKNKCCVSQFLNKKFYHGRPTLGRGIRGRRGLSSSELDFSLLSMMPPQIDLAFLSATKESLEEIPRKRSRNRSRERNREYEPLERKLEVEPRYARIEKVKNIYAYIISNFEAEGYWKYEDLSSKLTNIKKVPKGFIKCSNEDNAICTCFILAYLHKNFQEKFDEWVLIKRKALKWLEANGVINKEIHGLFDEFIN